MPQLNRNPQELQRIQQNQNGVGQFVDLLNSLLQTKQAQASQMNAAEVNIQQNQQRMGQSGNGDIKPQPNAYQKGVDKALQESGYAHASEAVMKGMDPMMVAQHSSQMGMNNAENQMMPLLKNLLSMASAPQQMPQQMAGYPQIQQTQQPMNSLQQQAESLVQPATGPLGKLFEAAGFGVQTKSRRLDNIAKAQKITGQEPIQPSTLLEQNIELMKDRASNINTQYQNIVSQENAISQQYVRDFEPLKQATDSVGKITALYEDSLKNPNNNVNDFFLVYNAIKAADPTAVKEGEYKTVQDLMPLASRVLNGINFTLKGEPLTPDQRSRLVKAAVTQYNGLAKRFEPLAKQYEDKVRSYNGDPKRALINYGAQGGSDIKSLEAELKRRGLI